jgi:death-on-curing family protein
MTAGRQPLYKTPFEKGAAIADAIVKNHVFNDANHRSAVASAHLVLGIYGMRLVASDDEQRDAIRDLGASLMEMSDFARWLEQNSVLRSPKPD